MFRLSPCRGVHAARSRCGSPSSVSGFLTVQHGHGAGKPLDHPRLAAGTGRVDPGRRSGAPAGGLADRRGNGKTSLLAALSVYKLFTSPTGGSIVCCARTQAQAQILFSLARDFVETSPELKERCQIGRERLYVPRNRTHFECLVSEPASLEGLNFSWCALDELGVTPRETVDVLMLAQGKRPESTLVGIGTPPPTGVDSVLAEWRQLAQETGEEHIVWREFTADGFDHHDLLCEHCIRLANPAYGDFLSMDAFKTAAATTREPAYRRSRLCQFVTGVDSPLVTPEQWADLCRPEPIPDGAEVVIALDGSHGGRNADATALVIGTVSATPHFDLFGLWESDGSHGFRVPVPEVEGKIREAQKRWQVKELVADPFRWNRSLQVLAADGLKVNEFPWSPSRLTRATTDLFSAATGGKFTHAGDEALTRHVLAASVIESNGGLRIGKSSRSRNAPKMDGAAALLMCHSRCVWLGTRKTKSRRTVSF